MKPHMFAAPQPVESCGSFGRILVVDDDPTQTLWSRHYLEEAGFEVAEAADGEGAIAAAKSGAPDLVLLDVMLPDMDGFQVCQVLKQDIGTREVPVLLATGLNDTCSVEKGYEAGATDFLSKPFSWALLVNRIKYLLRNDDLRRKLQEISDQQKVVNLALEQKVKERSRAEQKVREMALHDPLTGLANRKKFHQDFAALLAGIGEGYCGVGVMFLDLDRFKQINDTFGHATGDGVLKAVAELLRVSTRSTDVVARLGGDEFAIVLAQHDDVGYAMRVAERILRELSEPIFIDGTRVSVGTSIGIMLTSDRHADPDQLISNADQALYQAKEAGRSQVRIFDYALGQKLRKSRQLENAFDGAWDRGELEILYQPKVAVDDGRMIGLEALVRWNHPEQGLLQPNAFIPMAEASGLITPMTYWLMRAVCQQQAAWAARGLTDCSASINVSPKVLEARSFVEETRHIVEGSGSDPSQLIFEITEEIALKFPDNFAQLIGQLRDIGIRLSIDDFGTGFSSIAYLRNFKVDEIKIDKVFVERIHTCERDAAICNTLIQLGHSLNTVVVAEGVTCRSQLDSLRKMGCDHVQGYLMSKPLSADQILAFQSDLVARSTVSEDC